MTLWKLEWLRLRRTRRWIALLGVYVFFGFVGPLTARYLPEIVDFAGGHIEGTVIQFPPPVPVDGMAQYVGNVVQIGTLVAVIVAAGALAFDAIPEMGVFLRTRVSDTRRILAPRFVVTVAAVAVSFVLGALAAWYETWALIGGLGAAEVIAGILYGIVFIIFVVALVAAVAGRAKTVLATVMISLVILLAMPVVGIVDRIGRWLPTYLGNSLAVLPGGESTWTEYLPAMIAALGASAGLLWLAAHLAQRREL